ncbi:MAG: hypothetical protein JST20_05185 [Bacteroidetes bacterium]|nr:hypothetical protein [Bacteroidota bacterium]
MAVYPLKSSKFTTLIIGKGRLSANIAEHLERSKSRFHILLEPNITDILNFEMNIPLSIPSYLEPYSHLCSSELPPVNKPPHFIIDVGPGLPGERAGIITDVTDEFPNAIVLTSCLSCTASELYGEIGLDTEVVSFNPLAFLMKTPVMEFAPMLAANDETAKLTRRYFSALGFECEQVEDRVGLVSPRILATLINEAAFAVLEKVGSAEDIDTAMKLGVNYPKGLLEWADEIGIDLIVNILETLQSEYGSERYRPCILLRQMLRSGWVGKFTGKGFYQHEIPAEWEM